MKEFRDTGYYVSSNGLIQGKRKMLNPTLTPYGYHSVCLYWNGKPKTFLVHRMVAELYVDGYQENLEINHIDGNKLNNEWTNLEWVSKQQNIQHFFSELCKRTDGNYPNSKLSLTQMMEIYELNINGRIYQREIAKQYGVDRSTITRVIKKIKKVTNE